MASQIQLAFYWISNCANCQSGNRASRLLVGWLAVLLDTARIPLQQRAYIARVRWNGRSLCHEIDIFTPTRIIACTTLPSNTVEITDGFSNACAVGFTLSRKTRRSRPFIFFVKPSRVSADNLFRSVFRKV